MLKIENLNRVRNNNVLTTKEKIYEIMNLLKQAKVIYINKKLEYVDNENILDYYQYNNYLVKVGKHNYHDLVSELIYEKIEQQQIIQKIIMACDSIVDEETKEIFIEYFFMRKSINSILNNHLISQYCFYKMLNDGISQFRNRLWF